MIEYGYPQQGEWYVKSNKKYRNKVSDQCCK